MYWNALAEVWLPLVKEGKEHAKADNDRSLFFLLRSTSFSQKKTVCTTLKIDIERQYIGAEKEAWRAWDVYDSRCIPTLILQM